MPIFSVVDMDENAFSAAYPLVRTAIPDVSVEQWLDYARKVRMRGGLLGLMGPQSTLLACSPIAAKRACATARFSWSIIS